ncbi:MAG: hypothetical protein HY400_03650, partial [Elusimicrobia bacterium]|nr:hypothetical protein [Elusimicrobiota bacterium]
NTGAPPQVVRTRFAGQIREANILNRDFWDGRDNRGGFVSSGFYTVRVVASDLGSQLSNGSTVQQTIAMEPLRIYDVAVAPLRLDQPNALISYQVSETMKVVIKIYKPGTSFDANGNPDPPESVSLIKRLVGVRPARTLINELWDGTDQKLALVPDAGYIFKIVASTDLAAIDSVTGNVVAGASLADDIIVAEVAVARSGSLDPKADFEANTFIYPNPIRGSRAVPGATCPPGTSSGDSIFQIYVPVQADVTLKIYNLAGDLIRSEGFGIKAPNSYVCFPWNRDNASGKTVAQGVYFGVVRQEGAGGQKDIFQTVKKILVP